jgi:DNA-binding transcriptional LysR family regulator
MRLIAEGFGIGWGPSWLVGPRLRSGAVVGAPRAWRTPEEPLWMVRSSGGRPPRRAAQVMAWLATLPPEGA